MSKKKILRFIRENRDLIKAAPVEQKVRLLKLIRGSIHDGPAPEEKQVPPTPTDSDYLEER